MAPFTLTTIPVSFSTFSCPYSSDRGRFVPWSQAAYPKGVYYTREIPPSHQSYDKETLATQNGPRNITQRYEKDNNKGSRVDSKVKSEMKSQINRIKVPQMPRKKGIGLATCSTDPATISANASRREKASSRENTKLILNYELLRSNSGHGTPITQQGGGALMRVEYHRKGEAYHSSSVRCEREC
ncbi:unnamed protein product [Pylaiella littoralis]